MRLQACRLVVILSLPFLASCDFPLYDPTLSAEYLDTCRRSFVDNSDDYVTLYEMFVEDGLTHLEMYSNRWQIDSYSCYPADSKPPEHWEYDGSPNADVSSDDTQAGVGIEQERLLHYKELVDRLAIRLVSKEGNDVVFYIRSFDCGAHDYVVEILKTPDDLAGTIVSSVDDMTQYGDQDYYLPLDDEWYLHYRNYCAGNVTARSRHPNGRPPSFR